MFKDIAFWACQYTVTYTWTTCELHALWHFHDSYFCYKPFKLSDPGAIKHFAGSLTVYKQSFVHCIFNIDDSVVPRLSLETSFLRQH